MIPVIDNKMMGINLKFLILSILVFGLIGCTATSTGTKPTTVVSGFDNTKRVSISPHGAACTSMSCASIGATWISKFPDEVGLSVYLFNNMVSIQAVDFNVDGEIVSLKNSSLTNFEIPKYSLTGTSEKTFITDYSIVEKILNSKRSWIRVHTSKGLIEDAIIDGGKDSKAFHALKRFDDQVKISK